MKYKKLLPKYQLGTLAPLASPDGYTNEELASINTESLSELKTEPAPQKPETSYDFEGVDLNALNQTTAVETTNVDTPIVDAASVLFDQEADRHLNPVEYFSKHGKFPTGQSIFLESQANVSEEQIPYQQYIDKVIQEELPNGFKEHKTQCMYGGKNVIQCSAGTQWNFMDPTIENYISGAEKTILGINGNGWTIGQNIIDSGGQRIYGLHGKNTSNLRRNMTERRKLEDLDLVLNNIMVGDVVEMYYHGSKYQAEANKMGTGDVHTTHVGQVTEDEAGDKFITHNIYGTWQTEPFEDILKANGTGKGTDPRYFVSGIVRPAFTEVSRNIRISDAPQQIKSATGIRTPQDMSPETLNGWQNIKGKYVKNSRGFLKGLEFYAPNVQKDFNISDEDMQNLILPSAFAIFGKESSFADMDIDAYKERVVKRKMYRSYKNTFKDFEHIPRWLVGKELADEIFNFDPLSEGPSQIKMESGSITKSWYASKEGKAYQKRYGINPETIYDPSIAAPATMLLTAKNIQLLKAGMGEGRWNTLDTLTKRNLIFKAHNKGIDAIFENEFVKDGKADIDGGIEIYRNLHLNRNSYTNLAQDFALALEIDYEGIKKDHTEAERIGYTAQIPKTAGEERAQSRKEFGQGVQDFFKSSGSSGGRSSSSSSSVSVPTPNISSPSRPSPSPAPSAPGMSRMPTRGVDISAPNINMPERGVSMPSPSSGMSIPSSPSVSMPRQPITSPISNIGVSTPDMSFPTASIQTPEIDTTPLVSARGAEANRQLHEMFRIGTIGDVKIEMPESKDIDVINSTPEEIRKAIAKSGKALSDTVDLSETFNLPEDSIPSIDRREIKELLSGTELEGLGSQIAPNIADSLQVARQWADVNPEIAAQIPDEVMSELLLSEELIENGGTKTLEELAEEYLSGTITPADSVLTPPPPIGDFEEIPANTDNALAPLPELRMGGYLPKYQDAGPKKGTVLETNPENLTAGGEQVFKTLYSQPEMVVTGKKPNTLKGKVQKYMDNPEYISTSPAVKRYVDEYKIHSQNPDLIKTFDRTGLDALPTATIKRKLGNFDPSMILYQNRQEAKRNAQHNNIYRGTTTKKPFTLDISGPNLSFARAGEQVEGKAILGGDFLEDEPTALLASEYRKPGAQRFEGQGKKININPEKQEYYGIVNNEFKVGKINEFSDKDVIVPIRWGGDYDSYKEGELPKSETMYYNKQVSAAGRTQRTSKEVTPMLTKEGEAAYTNSASGKMIIYSPSTGQKRFLFGYDKDGMREESQKFKKQYKDAKYITLDTGRFNMIAVNKEGLTKKDFIDYSSGSFENEIGSGYNIVYNPK